MFHKHHLLLDEGVPPRKFLPRTNQKHTLKHIVSDLKLPSTRDESIYYLASKYNYLIVTLNGADFKQLVKTNAAGVVGLSSRLSPKQIDTKLLAFLKKHTPHQCKGKFFSLTGESFK